MTPCDVLGRQLCGALLALNEYNSFLACGAMVVPVILIVFALYSILKRAGLLLIPFLPQPKLNEAKSVWTEGDLIKLGLWYDHAESAWRIDGPVWDEELQYWKANPKFKQHGAG